MQIFQKLDLLKFLNNSDFDFVINCERICWTIQANKIILIIISMVAETYIKYFQKKINKFIQIGSSSEYGLAKSPQKENLKGLAKDNYGKPKLDASNFP